jgi:hypothetical protein
MISKDPLPYSDKGFLLDRLSKMCYNRGILRKGVYMSEQIQKYIRFLEKQGYTVLSPQETEELETFPGDICDLNLAIDAMRKADAAIE